MLATYDGLGYLLDTPEEEQDDGDDGVYAHDDAARAIATGASGGGAVGVDPHVELRGDLHVRRSDVHTLIRRLVLRQVGTCA